MVTLLAAIRTRLLPALVTAMGVVLVTAGLLSYADPTAAGTAVVGSPVVASPVIETMAPSEISTSNPAEPTPSADPSASSSAGPTASPTDKPAGRAVATRVVIPALRIDLPVIRGNDGYPLCDVAMYIRELAQPGENRATYLYAHARDGMFGPIYELAIQQQNGKKMLGMVVQVYTSDDKLYLYEIREVRTHVLPDHGMDAPFAAKTEELWLQTSEGAKGTPGKTQLRALLLTVGSADPKDAHPDPKPVKCG
jgi:sortase (surface protein transpeptidase)